MEENHLPFKRGWKVGISCSFITSGSLLTFREDCVPGATTTMSSIFARCLAGDGDARRIGGWGKECIKKIICRFHQNLTLKAH